MSLSLQDVTGNYSNAGSLSIGSFVIPIFTAEWSTRSWIALVRREAFLECRDDILQFISMNVSNMTSKQRKDLFQITNLMHNSFIL